MKANKLLSVLLTMFLLTSVISINVGIPVSAAMAGAGTRQNPYLVKTAQDLFDMRKNLSAHYKLAATIDLSKAKLPLGEDYKKGNFEPIGRYGQPFTGSFTCDLGPDKLPKYAIKNMNIFDDKGIKYKHTWESENGYMEAETKNSGQFEYDNGLFGTLKNATISNIYVLSSSVTASAVGQWPEYWVNAGTAHNYSRFLNEMGVGLLAGIAKDSVITGCAVTGNINSNSNQTGSFIGWIQGSTVTSCRSNVKLRCDGVLWVGGFIGNVESGASIRFCYAEGTMKALCNGYNGAVEGTYLAPHNNGRVSMLMRQASFVGGAFEGTTISDCYTAVKYEPNHQANGANFVRKQGQGDAVPKVINCYTLTGNSYVKGNKNPNPLDNCWSEAPGFEHHFMQGSRADIKAAFSGKEGWDTSGDYPRIKSIPVLSSESIYVAGKEREGLTGSTSSTSSNSTESLGSKATVSDNTSSTSNGESYVTSSESDSSDYDDQSVTEESKAESESEPTVSTVQTPIIPIIVLVVIMVVISALTVAIMLNILKGKRDSSL